LVISRLTVNSAHFIPCSCND